MIHTPPEVPIIYRAVYRCRLCRRLVDGSLIGRDEGDMQLGYVDGHPEELYPSTAISPTVVHVCSEVLRGFADLVGLAVVPCPDGPAPARDPAEVEIERRAVDAFNLTDFERVQVVSSRPTLAVVGGGPDAVASTDGIASADTIEEVARR